MHQKDDTPDPYGEVDEEFDLSLSFDQIVDPANWQAPGDYFQSMPAAARAAVSEVVDSDEQMRRELRERFLPAMVADGRLRCWNKADPRLIEMIQQKRLYSGQVVAADSTLAKFESLSLVGAQIAVSKVGYQGSTGQIVSNIMHWGREVPRRATASQIAEALRSRGRELKDKLPNVFLYTLTQYKERQLLLDSPPGTFKLIQGPVFPYEMLAGSGTQLTMLSCLKLLGELIDDGDYATIVSHESDRDVILLGTALDAGEYLVVRSGTEILEGFEAGAHYTTTPIDEYGRKSQKDLIDEFRKRYGPKVVQGVLRAHRMSRPYVFYCNEDRLEHAVHTLLADAANTGARGFPLLIDLADQYCSGAFRAGEYTSHMNAEFTRAAGGSAMYQSERSTRD